MAALMTGSADIAQDCVQETFVRVLQSATTHERGTLRAYLSTIVYRLALKENSRQTRRPRLRSVEPPSSDPSPLDATIADERHREVARVIRDLPDHHREILILRLHGEHSYEEIAEITGIPVGTVKSRIFHAVKSARLELRKRGVL
jgi:RNA polymerase sigma-70 factor (ECF subfamily)